MAEIHVPTWQERWHELAVALERVLRMIELSEQHGEGLGLTESQLAAMKDLAAAAHAFAEDVAST
jgi:hypothetical protein